MTDVRKTRPPTTTGDDHPMPGTGVFQAMFSVALQVSGSRGSSAATPNDPGPRNWGQSLAAEKTGAAERLAAATKTAMRM